MPTTAQHVGPLTQEADDLHAMKYRERGESFRERMNAIAFTLKDDDKHYHLLRDALLHQRFLPGGRIQGAAGAIRQTTYYNCFVSGTIADSYTDGPGSIMQRAHEAAATMRMGGGVGYDFSTLRPRGAAIKRLQSTSSGPISFMRIFNEICLCTSSSGHRRGAQMAILRCDHPDIEEFVLAKQNSSALTGFNISVAVTDAFMEAALSERPFDLTFDGHVYKTIDAAALWERIMRSTWDWAEPGVIFIDAINRFNNLHYCETIAATNPCSEQPLGPHSACLLGSFNLTKYLTSTLFTTTSTEPRYSFDWDQLIADIPPIVRAMDNVVDHSLYPLPEQQAEALNKRRMGLGITGLANCAEALGHPYGTSAFIAFEERILHLLQEKIYAASAALAAEKGPFPLFDSARYLAGLHIATLSDEVRHAIAHKGIRNSHLTSIAPTGTISMCADNVSSSIEPVFAYTTERQINTPDGASTALLHDYGSRFLNTRGRLTDTISAGEHLQVLTTAQRYIDSAISKTINMDGHTMPWSDFKDIYRIAWEQGAKGVTTFNKSGKRAALLHTAVEDTVSACTINPTTGARSCE